MCIGLITILLGAVILIVAFTDLIYIPLSAVVTIWGLSTFYTRLRGFDRIRRRRIILSEVSVLTAILTFYSSLFVASYRSPSIEEPLRFIGNPIVFISSWTALLVGVILLRPTLRYIGVKAGDRTFPILTDVLISGFALTPILVGIFIVLPTLVFMLSRIPSVVARISVE